MIWLLEKALLYRNTGFVQYDSGGARIETSIAQTSCYCKGNAQIVCMLIPGMDLLVKGSTREMGINSRTK